MEYETVAQILEDRQRLRAELAAAQRDAERYRWLRTLHLGYTSAPSWDAVLLIPTASAEHTTLDQLVDAALAAKGE